MMIGIAWNVRPARFRESAEAEAEILGQLAFRDYPLAMTVPRVQFLPR